MEISRNTRRQASIVCCASTGWQRWPALCEIPCCSSRSIRRLTTRRSKARHIPRTAHQTVRRALPDGVGHVVQPAAGSSYQAGEHYSLNTAGGRPCNRGRPRHPAPVPSRTTTTSTGGSTASRCPETSRSTFTDRTAAPSSVTYTVFEGGQSHRAGELTTADPFRVTSTRSRARRAAWGKPAS